MKKTLSLIIIFIAFLIIYFLQLNFFNWFTIAGIKPNLFIVLIVFVGLFLGKYYGFGIGVILGLLLDFFIGKIIGLNAITLGISGFLGGYFTKNFQKDSRMTIMFISLGATLICEVIAYIFQILILKLDIEVISFLKILIIEALYNVLIIIIIYPLIQSLGNKLQEIFTKENRLTRYF